MNWEKHTRMEERFNEGICRATRQECGLPMEAESLECSEEPCRVVCPFSKVVLV
ncbi:hypothetical protein [Methanobacterium sp. CWC-01]|uniref:hypothetical protein n=1 Tax=Methanobacterium aridiramus TaxID=2584467 RepID=UPI0025779533|nr:hypothetical protein [Methanobacterium sp. CWC-01]